jgi:phenylacetate-CoA ligase
MTADFRKAAMASNLQSRRSGYSADMDEAERVTAHIKAVAPDTPERSLGKAKRVFDKRPKR